MLAIWTLVYQELVSRTFCRGRVPRTYMSGPWDSSTSCMKTSYWYVRLSKYPKIVKIFSHIFKDIFIIYLLCYGYFWYDSYKELKIKLKIYRIYVLTQPNWFKSNWFPAFLPWKRLVSFFSSSFLWGGGGGGLGNQYSTRTRIRHLKALRKSMWQFYHLYERFAITLYVAGLLHPAISD